MRHAVVVTLENMTVIVGPNGHAYRARDGKELLADMPACDGGASPMARGDQVVFTTGERSKHPQKGLSLWTLSAPDAETLKAAMIWHVPDPALDTRAPAWVGDCLYHPRQVKPKCKALTVYDATTSAVLGTSDFLYNASSVCWSVAGKVVIGEQTCR